MPKYPAEFRRQIVEFDPRGTDPRAAVAADCRAILTGSRRDLALRLASVLQSR
jgi:hypothetical protein